MNGQNDKKAKNTLNAPSRLEHEIMLSGREKLYISGVEEVVSFDDVSAVIKTVGGELTVEGEGIRIGELDSTDGKVSLSGSIDALFYSSETPERKKGMFRRLFG